MAYLPSDEQNSHLFFCRESSFFSLWIDSNSCEGLECLKRNHLFTLPEKKIIHSVGLHAVQTCSFIFKTVSNHNVYSGL